ncbi:helix-turn-helix domain-containing protein [Streptomyces sp. TLI_105]|uniref:helix-turn-helix domain-containing protein n=1 Tax=Streptomyces sp. TLI_105 TaxID=1881019 RepID=UPI000898A54F|nr:helix-turn-helix domain-containing protein [Streptomyces sp. TLI_105]SEB77462.1 AraC-type DNA-binding protein [Streptomyces sp. TLI_105]
MTLTLMSRAPERVPRQTTAPTPPSSRSGWLVQMLSEMPDANDRNHVYLGVHVRGPVTVVHERAKTLLEPNDLVFCDPARRHLLRFGEDCQMIFFRVPRCYLGVTESELDQVLGVPVRGGEGIGALASDFLTALAAKAEFRRSTIGDRRARTAVHLLSVLVMELLEAEMTDAADDASGAGNEMLSRVHAHIEEHLMDPDLSPESIARAHHISVRYLQKLFQNDGSTVSQWVRQRRLESCRFELGRSSRRTTMAAMAHRWGFSSPSHFSRTFRGAYGMSPSEWQALATSAFAPMADDIQDERRR